MIDGPRCDVCGREPARVVAKFVRKVVSADQMTLWSRQRGAAGGLRGDGLTTGARVLESHAKRRRAGRPQNEVLTLTSDLFVQLIQLPRPCLLYLKGLRCSLLPVLAERLLSLVPSHSVIKVRLGIQVRLEATIQKSRGLLGFVLTI